MARVLIGALVAGIVVFAWGAVSHMLLPTAGTGIRKLPDEERLVAQLRGTVASPGVYMYPVLDVDREPTEEEQAAWEAAYELGPRGLIVFHAGGDAPMSPKRFGSELLSNVLAALVAAVVLSLASASFLGRALIVTAMGLFAWLSVNVSYWIWFGFPLDFVLAEAVDQIAGWLLGGIALAAIVRKRDAVS